MLFPVLTEAHSQKKKRSSFSQVLKLFLVIFKTFVYLVVDEVQELSSYPRMYPLVDVAVYSIFTYFCIKTFQV